MCSMVVQTNYKKLGGAMVLGKLPVLGHASNLKIVGQGVLHL